MERSSSGDRLGGGRAGKTAGVRRGSITEEARSGGPIIRMVAIVMMIILIIRMVMMVVMVVIMIIKLGNISEYTPIMLLVCWGGLNISEHTDTLHLQILLK